MHLYNLSSQLGSLNKNTHVKYLEDLLLDPSAVGHRLPPQLTPSIAIPAERLLIYPLVLDLDPCKQSGAPVYRAPDSRFAPSRRQFASFSSERRRLLTPSQLCARFAGPRIVETLEDLGWHHLLAVLGNGSSARPLGSGTAEEGGVPATTLCSSSLPASDIIFCLFLLRWQTNSAPLKAMPRIWRTPSRPGPLLSPRPNQPGYPTSGTPPAWILRSGTSWPR